MYLTERSLKPAHYLITCLPKYFRILIDNFFEVILQYSNVRLYKFPTKWNRFYNMFHAVFISLKKGIKDERDENI